MIFVPHTNLDSEMKNTHLIHITAGLGMPLSFAEELEEKWSVIVAYTEKEHDLPSRSSKHGP